MRGKTAQSQRLIATVWVKSKIKTFRVRVCVCFLLKYNLLSSRRSFWILKYFQRSTESGTHLYTPFSLSLRIDPLSFLLHLSHRRFCMSKLYSLNMYVYSLLLLLFLLLRLLLEYIISVVEEQNKPKQNKKRKLVYSFDFVLFFTFNFASRNVRARTCVYNIPMDSSVCLACVMKCVCVCFSSFYTFYFPSLYFSTL